MRSHTHGAFGFANWCTWIWRCSAAKRNKPMCVYVMYYMGESNQGVYNASNDSLQKELFLRGKVDDNKINV